MNNTNNMNNINNTNNMNNINKINNMNNINKINNMNIYLSTELVKYIFEFVNMNNIINHIHGLNYKLNYKLNYAYNNGILYDNNITDLYGNIHDRTNHKIIYKKHKIFIKCGMRLLIHNKLAQLNRHFKRYFNNGLILNNDDKQFFIQKYADSTIKYVIYPNTYIDINYL